MNETKQLIEAIEIATGRIIARLDVTNEILAKISGKDTIQRVIRPEEVDDYLSKDWKYVNSFNNGRETFVIVEIDADLRR